MANKKMVIPMVESPLIGYVPAIFVVCPLPYRNQGDTYTRSYGKVEVKMYSAKGIPYGKMGRCVMSLITTQAILQQSPHIELGGITDTFAKMDIQLTGGKTGSIKRVTESFEQFARLFLTNTVDIRDSPMNGYMTSNLRIAEKIELYWNGKDKDLSSQKGLFSNILDLSPEYYEVMKKSAVPIDIVQYNAIQSPRTQDIYAWVVRRMFGLSEKVTVPWEPLYGQFADKKLDPRKYPDFRDDMEQSLLLVKEIYPESKVVMDVRNGITLAPSPSHIKPEKKGFVC